MANPFDNPYRIRSDNLLDITFETPGLCVNERIQRLNETAEQLVTLLFRNWEESPTHNGPALHAAATLACLPSLLTVAQGQKHTLETAEEVSENLQDLACHISEHQLTLRPNPRLKGALSEVGVLSVLWHGIASGFTSDESYARTTNADQDRGTLIGRRNGVDIIQREGGRRKPKRPIQVKSRSLAEKNPDLYAPGIAVISPEDLVPNHSYPIAKLNQALVKNDREVLDPAWQISANMIDDALK